MKQFFVIFLIIQTFISCKAQMNKTEFTYDDFEKQVIRYQPKQNDLSDKDYNHGIMILSETKNYVKNDPNNFNRADYFNILSCFLSLKENKETINITFEKFKNSEGSCEYFLDKTLFKSPKYDIVREEITKQSLVCEQSTPMDSTPLDLNGYSQKNNFDVNLIMIINEISISDEKYRKDETTDWSKQTPIDKENQKMIDSLYDLHESYIGKTLVGEKFGFVMWSVIQHSNVDMMEKYLPIIQKAVEEKELEIVPFKMLIDRFYGLKYGYQIFGSQSGFGFKLADDKKRKEIELKYGIE